MRHYLASAHFRECSRQAVAGGTRTRNLQASATSTSGSSTNVGEERTLGVSSVHTVDKNVPAVCIPSEIPRLGALSTIRGRSLPYGKLDLLGFGVGCSERKQVLALVGHSIAVVV
jgi:hypothetical protein